MELLRPELTQIVTMRVADDRESDAVLRQWMPRVRHQRSESLSCKTKDNVYVNGGDIPFRLSAFGPFSVNEKFFKFLRR
jgi:hypothetical protein